MRTDDSLFPAANILAWLSRPSPAPSSPQDNPGACEMKDPRKTELRCEILRDTAAVLDGVSLANHQTRGELVNELLNDFASKKRTEHTMLCRVAGLNPTAAASA